MLYCNNARLDVTATEHDNVASISWGAKMLRSIFLLQLYEHLSGVLAAEQTKKCLGCFFKALFDCLAASDCA
jgi:hypothetical protein